MRRSVVIVDHHAGFRARARALLAAAGYEVTGEAGDGVSGVRPSRDAADHGGRIGRSGARGFIGKAELSAGALEAVLKGSGR